MSHPIPSAALDDRLAFVGTPGSGKTYNAGSGVERLLASGARVVIPDPLGVWWGLALAKDGKSPSTFRKNEKLVIFGGPHGDLPLTEHTGALIGETVAGMAESCILDLSELGTKAGERRFMLAFLTALYKSHSGQLMHLIFDEADMWAPQRLLDKDGEAAKLLGMMETVVRRGRKKGFIPWFITQRPAVLSWNVLSMIDGVVTFKLTSSHDRDAIGNWVEGQADKAQWKAIWTDLPTLERGEGFVWLPTRGILKRSKFPEKVTFDSSRAPKRGERIKSAKKLKPVNLDKLKERLATVEAETKANDPKKLRAEIATLRAEKAKLEQAPPAKPVKPGKDLIAIAEKRGLDRGEKVTRAAADKSIKNLRTALEAAMKFIVEINAKGFFKAGGDAIDKKAVEKAIKDATDNITKMIGRHLEGRDKEIARLREGAGRIINRLKAVIDQDVAVKVDVHANEPFTITPTPAAPRSTLALVPATGDGTYTGAQRKILASLATWRALGHDTPSREMVAAIAGYPPSSGGFKNPLGALKTAGVIDYPRSGVVTLLVDAIEAMSKEEGRDRLIATLSGAQRKIAGALLGHGERTRDEVAADSGYPVDSGGFKNPLGALRTLGIVDYPSSGIVAMSQWAAELLEGETRLAA